MRERERERGVSYASYYVSWVSIPQALSYLSPVIFFEATQDLVF